MTLSRRRRRRYPLPSPSCQSRRACPRVEHGPLPVHLSVVVLLLLLVQGEGDLLHLLQVFCSIKPRPSGRRTAYHCHRCLPRHSPSLHPSPPRPVSLHPSLPRRTPSRLLPTAGTNKGILGVSAAIPLFSLMDWARLVCCRSGLVMSLHPSLKFPTVSVVEIALRLLRHCHDSACCCPDRCRVKP